MTITEFTHGTKADQAAQRLEIFTGPACDEEKERVVAELRRRDVGLRGCAAAWSVA
ncbi:hypothetical protein QN224_32925 [Sinorhizobium sp. 8-89]|uniref:hypothetical protein n=1 Tax=Sinorhizobium sp. 7-81 TaxID=3049087 RepID=UPI0024C45A01|nr:hypothetical protein [Sinorhizobium sp. 7-81]MDK1390108.1 hypothetical protein [Sinorhizobium sp. 7-81]